MSVVMQSLETYLTEQSIKQADFAEQLKVSQATVSRLAKGTMRPSLDLAFAIERATGGAVPVASWNPDPAAKDESPTPPTEDAA